MDQDYCLICYGDENVLYLNCGHCFCKNCLKNLYENRMKQKFYSLYCPECQQSLSIQIINQISSTLKLNENQELLFKLNEELKKVDKEKLQQCLNPGCDQTFLIWKDSDYFTCQQCQKSYCLKCNQIKHQPKSCIENLRFQQNQKSRMKFFKDTTEKYNNKVCPHCFMMIEKNDGCNFITCQSKQCNSQKYFCYQCGIPLQKKDQSKHFSMNDSYLGQCRIFYDNNWYDEDQIPQNDFACPQCQSINPLECNLEENIINCKSNICKGKLFCKICEIEMNDKNILDHLNDHNKIITQTYIKTFKNFVRKLNFF